MHQRIRQVLDDAIGEIATLTPVAEVVKWQNSNRALGCEGGGRCRRGDSGQCRSYNPGLFERAQQTNF